jgi:hypothetical protein
LQPHLLRQLRGASTSAAAATSHGTLPQLVPHGPPATADQLPLHTGRPRLVVIGTGWGGARLLHDIDPKLYDLTVISQRNHMVFTPLLSSTTVGTIDPRSVTVHVTDIQRALFQVRPGH